MNPGVGEQEGSGRAYRGSPASVMSLAFLLCALLPAVLASEATDRGINSSGLWSRYNLVVKPTLAVSSPSPRISTKLVLSSSTPAPKPRWEEEDEEAYGPEIPDDKYDVEDVEDDEKDDEEEEEDEEDFVAHTTQRSKGDSAKRKKKHKRKSHHKVGKGTKGVKHYKNFKSLKKYMLPLLIAYKLKFFTLIPLLLGGLMLIVATTGFAGFFFALFAVGVGLKKD